MLAIFSGNPILEDIIEEAKGIWNFCHEKLYFPNDNQSTLFNCFEYRNDLITHKFSAPDYKLDLEVETLLLHKPGV